MSRSSDIQIAVTLSFQDGVTQEEVRDFILALSDKLVEERSKVLIEDIWGIEEYDHRTQEPVLSLKSLPNGEFLKRQHEIEKKLDI